MRTARLTSSRRFQPTRRSRQLTLRFSGVTIARRIKQRSRSRAKRCALRFDCFVLCREKLFYVLCVFSLDSTQIGWLGIGFLLPSMLATVFFLKKKKQL